MTAEARSLVLTYHGRPYRAVPCGTFGRRRTQLYWLEMASTSAIVKAGPKAKSLRSDAVLQTAIGVLTHAGTSASAGQFDRNLAKIAWDDHELAKAWARRQLAAHAARQRDRARHAASSDPARSEAATERALSLEASIRELAPKDPQVEPKAKPAPTTFVDAVTDAHAEVEKLEDRSVEWRPDKGATPYMDALERAAELGTPAQAEELNDMYGDVMVSRHPAAARHGARLLELLKPPVAEFAGVDIPEASP